MLDRLSLTSSCAIWTESSENKLFHLPTIISAAIAIFMGYLNNIKFYIKTTAIYHYYQSTQLLLKWSCFPSLLQHPSKSHM